MGLGGKICSQKEKYCLKTVKRFSDMSEKRFEAK